MAIRTRLDTATGKHVLFIDLRWKTSSGKRDRYRRDAQVQTRAAAVAEERRLLAVLAATGTIPKDAPPEPAEAVEASELTWVGALANFETAGLPRLKPSTRDGYDELLASAHFASLRELTIDEVVARMPLWDAEIVSTGVSASRRRNLHVVLRSVLRTAVESKLLPAMPALPALPKVGKTVPEVVHLDDLRRILEERDDVKGVGPVLAASRRSVRFAICLAAFAGLRIGEVRALRWTDVDLRRRVITVRLALSHGVEAPPKSGSERELPNSELLLPRLAAAAEDARQRAGRTEEQGPPPDALVAGPKRT